MLTQIRTVYLKSEQIIVNYLEIIGVMLVFLWSLIFHPKTDWLLDTLALLCGGGSAVLRACSSESLFTHGLPINKMLNTLFWCFWGGQEQCFASGMISPNPFIWQGIWLFLYSSQIPWDEEEK